jgi:hypothetical protein
MGDNDFYGIEPGTVPGYAELGGPAFLSIDQLPERTVETIAAFMGELRLMHDQDPLAFDVRVQHVAAAIDARNEEGSADPRERP